MRATRIGIAAASVLVVGLLPIRGYALPHGCISATSDYTISADLARRSLGLQVYTNEPCTFYFSPGDTFSGSGEYKVECETGGVATDSLAQGLQVQVPIPQPCDPGAVVTIYANHFWRGGMVVAGSPL